MHRWQIRWVVAVALVLIASGVGRSMTCDQCQEIEKKKKFAEQQIAEHEKQLQNAVEKRQYQKVTEIRALMIKFRKEVMDLTDQEKPCKDACKPDVVKEFECSKLRAEIVKLEGSDAPEGGVEKIDSLYRDLLRCNKELLELQKGSQ